MISRSKMPVAFATTTAVLVGALGVAWYSGPRVAHHSVCGFCGRVREAEWWLGYNIKDVVTETAESAWVDSMYPDHVDHFWVPISRHGRGWFGNEWIGCGGIGAVRMLYEARARVGEPEAVRWLRHYHEELRAHPDLNSLHTLGVRIGQVLQAGDTLQPNHPAPPDVGNGAVPLNCEDSEPRRG